MNLVNFLKYSFFNLFFHKLNEKKLIPIIEKEVESGATKSSIFQNLSSEIKEYDELAFLINSVTSQKRKNEFKRSNRYILFCIYIFIFTLVLEIISSMANLGTLIWLFIAIFLLFQLINYRPRAYFFVIVMSAINIITLFFESKAIIRDEYDMIFVFLFVLYFLFLLILSHNVKSKLYPSYTYMGPKVDENGEYIFSE